MRTRRFAVVLACLAIPLTLGVGAATATGGGSQPYCGIVWGSLPKSGGDLVPTPITGVRIGRHECFDRVVIDVSGTGGSPVPGYFARYTDGVVTPGEGAPLTVAGGATLTIQALAPSYNDAGQATVPWRSGAHVANPTNFRTLRDVVFAGSFEGESTFGIGVRARLPYRVFTLESPNRLVVDIAHRW